MSKKKKRSRLEKLLRSWSKATPQERRQFLEAIATNAADQGFAETQNAVPIASGRYLTEETVRKTRHVMKERKVDLPTLSDELGLPKDDSSLKRAIETNHPLRLTVIRSLQLWLLANAGLKRPTDIKDDKPA